MLKKQFISQPKKNMIDDELFQKIRHIEIKSKKLVNEVFSGEYHSVFKGTGINFSDSREYVAGDDIRFIDWNSTARYCKPFVKVFNEERQLNVTFMIDASASLNFSSSPKSKLEIAAEISALLAFAAIKNNDKTGIIIFTDEIEKFISHRYGKKHTLLIIREILAYKPERKKTDISKSIEFALKSLKKKSVIFFISDFFDENYTDQLAKLQNKHDVTAVLLTDRLEKSIDDYGIIKFSDPETGKILVFDSSSEKNRNYFSKQSAILNENIKNSFIKYGIDFIEISTEGSYVEPLIKYFKNKIKRKN